MALVLIVLAPGLPRRGLCPGFRGQGAVRRGVKLLALLVQADDGARGVVGPLVHSQHVLHLGDESGGGLREAPGLHLPGLDLVKTRARVRVRAGPAVVVRSVEKKHSDIGIPVYNLIVKDDHTYFVGNHGEWVHNGIYDCTNIAAGKCLILNKLNYPAVQQEPFYSHFCSFTW